MTTTADYGSQYWGIKSDLSESGDIYLNADRLEITPSGVLIAWGRWRRSGEKPSPDEPEFVCIALAPGHWTAAFGASVMDGAAVAVEHWKGEVVR